MSTDPTCRCGHPESDHADFPPGVNLPPCKHTWTLRGPGCDCQGFELPDEFVLTDEEADALWEAWTYDHEWAHLCVEIQHVIRKRVQAARRGGTV